MGRQMLLTIALIQMVGIGAVVVASDHGHIDHRDSAASAQLDSRNSNETHIQGTLSCAIADKNTNQACDLRLQGDNGINYTISSTSPAMRLYQDGHLRVAIDGRTIGDRLNVLKAIAL